MTGNGRRFLAKLIGWLARGSVPVDAFHSPGSRNEIDDHPTLPQANLARRKLPQAPLRVVPTLGRREYPTSWIGWRILSRRSRERFPF